MEEDIFFSWALGVACCVVVAAAFGIGYHCGHSAGLRDATVGTWTADVNQQTGEWEYRRSNPAKAYP